MDQARRRQPQSPPAGSSPGQTRVLRARWSATTLRETARIFVAMGVVALLLGLLTVARPTWVLRPRLGTVRNVVHVIVVEVLGACLVLWGARRLVLASRMRREARQRDEL